MMGRWLEPPVLGSPTRWANSLSSSPWRRLFGRRPVGPGIDQRLDQGQALTGCLVDRQQPQAQTPAELEDASALAAPDRAGRGLQRHRDREVDLLGEGQPIDALEHERQGEGGLELDDHGRLITSLGHEVTPSHLCLDLVALGLQEGLDRRVEVLLAFESHVRESILQRCSRYPEPDRRCAWPRTNRSDR